jgi:glycine dehydrogenase
MLGGQGLADASKMALLSANYMAARLAPHYAVRFTNARGRVAHELLIDLAEFDRAAGLKVADFAKRLQDYGFHPPTVAWPTPTCMLIEPTESESLEELERFCEAMIRIRGEAEDVVAGRQPRDDNVLKNAPHPIAVVVGDKWERPYSREAAVYPLPWLREKKFWPAVSRVDDGALYGSCCRLSLTAAFYTTQRTETSTSSCVFSMCCARLWTVLTVFAQCDCPTVEETAHEFSA